MLCTQDQDKRVEAVTPAKNRMRASLRLAFGQNNATGETTLDFSHQDPPLRVVRAFQTETHSAMAHLHNVSGGLFGGDDLTLDVEVRKGAEAQLTTTGATRIYRRAPGNAVTRQRNEFTVLEDALLEYVPDAIIPFMGANFHQDTTVRLSANAGLFWWEILAPGREASNELFAFESVEMRTELFARDQLIGDQLISVDRMRLEPGRKAIASPARMGSFRYCATFYVCKVGASPDIWMDLEQQLRSMVPDLPRLEETLWGTSMLKAHGLMIRCLAKQGSDVTSGLLSMWDAAKFALYCRHAVRPRKTG